MADATPPPPPVDDKDWTWVLEQVCPECGEDVRSFPRDEMGARLRANVEAWLVVLDDPRVADRPDAEHWSALEYAAHVRDVYGIYAMRLGLMLSEEGPHYPNWDQNVTAVEQRYDQSDPAVVGPELRDAGLRLADDFDAVTGDQWARAGYRGDGAEFTVETFARYLLHDPLHHLDDVAKGFERMA